MSRPRKCKLCTGDPAITGQINAMIEAGVKLKTIAEQVPAFSPYQLSRHKRCRVLKGAPELTSEVGSAEIQKWLQRAEDTYILASANQDAKSAVSAISAATRALSGLHKQVERETERAEKTVGSAGQFTVESLDTYVREYAAKAKAAPCCLVCGTAKPKEQNEVNAN